MVSLLPPIGLWAREAMVKVLQQKRRRNIVARQGEEADLCDSPLVDSLFAQEKPEYAFLAAGKSAEIMGNIQFQAELKPDNLLGECHVIESACSQDVTKPTSLPSSRCYPSAAANL